MAMSPILTDELRPVGGAWPAAEKHRLAPQRKRKFRKFRQRERLEGTGQRNRRVAQPGLAARRAFARLRQAITVPIARQTLIARKSRLFTRAWNRSTSR